MLSELILFDGGLSTKTSPHLIKRNEAVICENVNLESGVMNPFPSLQYVETTNGKYIYPYAETIISNQVATDVRFYDTYGGRVYWSNDGYSTNGLMRYDGTNNGVLAEAPDPYPQANAPVTTTEVSIYGQLTFGATYTYALTIVNPDGVESAPVFLADVTLGTASKPSVRLSVDKTLIATYLPANHTVNIYRTGGDNPTFNLVVENMGPTNEKVVDGDTTSDSNYPNGFYHYVDTVADIDVSRIELTTFENTTPPDNIDMLIENNGTFWGATGKKVYFSRTGSPEYWGLLDFVTLDKDCTGLGKFGDSIIAFTRTSAYQITGYNRDNVVLQRLPFNQGCTNKHSVVNIDAYVLWTSLNGICLFDGSTVQVITKKTLAWDEFGRLGNTTYDDYNNTNSKWNSGLGFDIKFAVGHQDKYYGVYNDGVMILDMANGLKVSTISAPNIASLAINEDDNLLYFAIDMFDGTFDIYTMINSESKMLATIKTGRISDGSINIKKHYRRVEIDGTPDSVTVYVDGVARHTATNKSIFMLPAGCIGGDVQFEIQSTSEIRSLKYSYSVFGTSND